SQETGSIFCLHNTLCRRQMLRRKTKSVKRQGWRDPSEQGCVSVFPLCRLSRCPGLKENGFIFSGDGANRICVILRPVAELVF
ncbi:hypothetical protein ACSGR4_000001, partial [Morganella morganii]